MALATLNIFDIYKGFPTPSYLHPPTHTRTNSYPPGVMVCSLRTWKGHDPLLVIGQGFVSFHGTCPGLFGWHPEMSKITAPTKKMSCLSLMGQGLRRQRRSHSRGNKVSWKAIHDLVAAQASLSSTLWLSLWFSILTWLPPGPSPILPIPTIGDCLFIFVRETYCGYNRVTGTGDCLFIKSLKHQICNLDEAPNSQVLLAPLESNLEVGL